MHQKAGILEQEQLVLLEIQLASICVRKGDSLKHMRLAPQISQPEIEQAMRDSASEYITPYSVSFCPRIPSFFVPA